MALRFLWERRDVRYAWFSAEDHFESVKKGLSVVWRSMPQANSHYRAADCSRDC